MAEQSGENGPFPAQDEQGFPTGWTSWGGRARGLYFPAFICTCPGVWESPESGYFNPNAMQKCLPRGCSCTHNFHQILESSAPVMLMTLP